MLLHTIPCIHFLLSGHEGGKRLFACSINKPAFPVTTQGTAFTLKLQEVRFSPVVFTNKSYYFSVTVVFPR